MKKVWEESAKETVLKFLPYLTDIGYDELKNGFESDIEEKQSNNNGVKKLYLVGPCIVTGEAQLKGEALPNILTLFLRKYGLDYEIICIRMNTTKENVFKKILEYNIYANDIIIFLERFEEAYDLDLTAYYLNDNKRKWFYQDTPIHTTKYGNEMIANVLITKIIKPVWKKHIREDNKKILCYAAPQLSYIAEQKIDQYVKNVNYEKEMLAQL